MISIVACCHSVKLYAFATWPFQTQQSGAMTRMCCKGGARCNFHKKWWNQCGLLQDGVNVIATSQLALHLKCDSLGMVCVTNSKTQIFVEQTSNNRVISSGDLYYCLLPWCEALYTWHSSFPIATQEIYRVFHNCLNKAIGHKFRILNDTTMMITFIER